MGRSNLTYYHQGDFRGGINEEPENARPDQVLDARNLWCQDGLLQQRPGSVGVTTLPCNAANLLEEPTTAGIVKVVSGTPTVYESGVAELDNLAVGDTWYVGFDTYASAVSLFANLQGFAFANVAGNSNSSWYQADYYNGSIWAPLTVTELPTTLTWQRGSKHLESTANTLLAFVPPADWTATSISTESTDLYYVRLRILTAALDADVQIRVTGGALNLSVWLAEDSTSLTSVASLYAAEFSFSKRYFGIGQSLNGYVPTHYVLNMADLYYQDNYLGEYAGELERPENGSLAVIPQFDSAYLAYDNRVNVLSGSPISAATAVSAAEVEDRPEYVGLVLGEKSPFHPDYIAQLGAWPHGKYVEFYHGQLWVAYTTDQPYTVRWSAPQPAYRVWPAISYELLMEDDNSPITGMRVLGEQLIIFKQDSVWAMEYTGTDYVGLNTYVPRKLISGVGCVSNSSIAAINGELVFLSEDGVYAINGAPGAVRKLSGNIDKTVSTINAGRRPYAAGVHWKTENVYLLAVSTGATDTNNTVLVWDYTAPEGGAWWIWDGIEAESWLADEGQFDDEVLYRVNRHGHIYRMGGSDTDHGATITSYVKLHRLGYGDFTTKTAREVRVNATNEIVGNIAVELGREDEASGTSGNISMTNSNEAKYGTAVYGTDTYVSRKRREKRLAFRKTGDHFNLKLTNSNKNMPMKIGRVSVGAIPHGRR